MNENKILIFKIKNYETYNKVHLIPYYSWDAVYDILSQARQKSYLVESIDVHNTWSCPGICYYNRQEKDNIFLAKKIKKRKNFLPQRYGGIIYY